MSDLGNREVFSRNLKSYMSENVLSIQTLAQSIGVPHSTLSDWYHGRTYPRIDKIEKLANFFGISKADLVEDHSSYYSDKTTAGVAEKIRTSPEMRLLFDAAADADPDDLRAVYNMLLALKKKGGS